MKYSLTKKQKELYDFILSCGDECPSFDEMRVHMKLKSKSGIFRLLSGLEERGAITRIHGKHRAIFIAERSIYNCTLPFPPSVNSMYGGGSGQQRFKSREYKSWEMIAGMSAPKCQTMAGPVHLSYMMYVPDKRTRDLSNYIKPCEDLLVARGIIQDDNHEVIRSFHVESGGQDKQRPRIEISIFNKTTQ